MFYFLVFLFPMIVFAAQGDLDSSFDGDGKVTTSVGSTSDYARGVAIQNDGKIVLAGSSFDGTDTDYIVVRYDTNGSLDTSFNAIGSVTSHIGIGTDEANDVAIADDGKIIAAGRSWSAAFGGVSTWGFSLIRYKSDGTLDNSFNGDGKVITDFGDTNDTATSMAIGIDGKIILAGYSGDQEQRDFALACYENNGSLDAAFGNNGKVITNFAGSQDEIFDIAIVSDGKIIVAGSSDSNPYFDFALARYERNGTLDSSFGVGGKVNTNFNNSYDHARSVVVQKDGKIIVAGFTTNTSKRDWDFALARYENNGTLDSSFGSNGKVITDVNPTKDDKIHSIALTCNGKIVAAGITDNGSNKDFVLVRYNRDGSLDTSFGTNGIVTTFFGIDGYEEAYDLAIQNDGKIIAVGDSSGSDIALARYKSLGCVNPAIFGYLLD